MKEKKQYAPGKHPNSQKNLKPCKKGETHNPKGRPFNKRLSLTSIANEKLGQPCPHAKGKTWAEYLVDQWLEQAAENAVYFRELLDRIEGKVTQPIAGQITVDTTFVIGKGYADSKPDIQPNQ